MFNKFLKNAKKMEKKTERYILSTHIRETLQTIGIIPEVTHELLVMTRQFEEDYKKLELEFLRKQSDYLKKYQSVHS